MTLRIFDRAILTALSVLALGVPPAQAAEAPKYALAPLAAVAPVRPCDSLAQVDLASATGAATSQSAREVAGEHPYCEVTGTIAPAVRFEVRLPLTGWTQRFLETGCGGLCGGLRIRLEKAEGCAPATDGTIALASTDMGHQDPEPDWGGNPQKRADFAHRGVHVTVLAAKALIQAFYGQAPRYAYFAGCSDGGREGLIAAQRYPGDFDGIAAGAPALQFSAQNSFHHAWLARANSGPDGKPLLTVADLPSLHAAVVKACDRLDGLADGQIDDPRACHFDPGAIACGNRYPEPGKCLTGPQVAAVREIYAGASGPHGERLEVGPIMRGSELLWTGVFVPASADAPIMSTFFALGTINHLLFTPNPQPPYSIANFPFDAPMFARLEPARKLYNADDPDLSPFAARGGKLILWHGWSDQHISPIGTIDYWARAGRAMGAGARDKAVRLFMLPGMGHCRGGDGPSEFPAIAALMSWVEMGQAPQVLIARRDSKEQSPRNRPVFAYPSVARYAGKGSLDDAASFTSVTPRRGSDIAGWIGSGR